MKKYIILLFIIVFGIIHISCSSSNIISKNEGEVIGQKTCTPGISIEIPKTKIELLSFLTWDVKELIITPTIIGGIDSLLSIIKYPEIAMWAGVSGPVLCEFTITTEGKASNTKIIQGIGAGCDEAVYDAVRIIKYTAALKDGKKIDQRMRASFNFILIKSKP